MTYTDGLREQMGQTKTPRFRIAPDEPTEITHDPEALAAREALIRQMAGGLAWADMRAAQRIGHVLFLAMAYIFLAVVVALFVGVALLMVLALADTCAQRQGPMVRACEDARADLIIRSAFSGGLVGAAGLLACLVLHREREIRRLRGLPDAALIREHTVWRDAMSRLASEERRRRDLDYQAERIAYWSDHYGRHT